MTELLEFIFAVLFLVIAFKLAMGCLKVVMWFCGVMLLATAIASILV